MAFGSDGAGPDGGLLVVLRFVSFSSFGVSLSNDTQTSKYLMSHQLPVSACTLLTVSISNMHSGL